MNTNKKGLLPPQEQASRDNTSTTSESDYIADILNEPFVDGLCAEVLALLRQGPTLSLVLTAIHAIPEATARIHDLRVKGFNIATTIQSEILFRGKIRKRVALYSLGNPVWPRPGYLPEKTDLPPAA